MISLHLVSCVGDSHKGPPIIKEKAISSQNNKNANELINDKLHLVQPRPSKQSAPAPLRRKLYLTRRLDAPSGVTPSRSRAVRPLGRNSASLEGWTPPLAKLRLARGLCAPSSETSPRSRVMRTLWWDSASLEARVGPPPQDRGAALTPQTSALNALARRGRPDQERIPATPAF
jgi:hypothetical protein